MSKHFYRDSSMVLKSRDAIRSWLPQGRLGFSVEDVDVSLRLFQANDPAGSWRLIENKVGTNLIGPSKEFHFASWDRLWRMSDPNLVLYKGYFVVNTPTDDWPACDSFRVNGVELTQGLFRRWLWADALDRFLQPVGEITDEDLLDAAKLAAEVSQYELVDIKPYQFRQWITDKVSCAVKGKLNGR